MSEIKTDTKHLENIIEKHTDVLEALDSALNHLTKALNLLQNEYEGHAAPMIEELAGPLKKHVRLLKGCYMCNRSYVQEVLATTLEQDEKLSGDISA